MNTITRFIRNGFMLFVAICLNMNAFAQKAAGNSKEENFFTASNHKSADVGTVSVPGTTTINKNEIEISAAGADIWGTKDAFHFCYNTIKGDFDISTQVMGLTATNMYTKAGIMARVDLDAGSQHVYYQLFPSNAARNKNNGGCEFQYRLEKAGQMKAIYPDLATAGNQYDVAYPNTWIRLKRTGDVFDSYMSSDNKNWKLYTTFTMTLPAELLVGLAVTAHDKAATTIAKFASVRLKK
jgi:regulation of enolase protein 1 (concanavalin A-like superfamily)